MELILIILFVAVCLLLNVVIVLQPGKGSGMGALGGGTGGSVFGARGAVPFLSKLTWWLTAAFMGLALALASMSIEKSAVSATAIKPLAPVTDEGSADEAKPAEGEAKPAEGEAKPAEGEAKTDGSD